LVGPMTSFRLFLPLPFGGYIPSFFQLRRNSRITSPGGQFALKFRLYERYSALSAKVRI
ncbi:hypothetical protein L9F63_019786, partial [Diploptera punctata]